MNRRDAVKAVTILMGGALTASTTAALLEGCNIGGTGGGKDFTDKEKEMITRIADIIIPATDTPGAAATGVGDFIVMMLQDVYTGKDRRLFHHGLADFDRECKRKYGQRFLDCPAARQEEAVREMDSKVLGEKALAANPRLHKLLKGLTMLGLVAPHFYHIFKELTLLGYFTSRAGATEALRYMPVPGRYDGCIPYSPGEKAWATE